MPAAEANDPSLNRALIVDEDPIALDALKEQLPTMGYSVTAVDTGSMALEHLKGGTFSIILANSKLPEMTGLELLDQAESLQPDASRLLLASGISMAELSEAISSGRIYRHISKPWLSEDLQVTFANAMERYRLLKENEALHGRNLELSEKLAQASAAMGGGEEGGEGGEGGGPALVAGEDLALESVNRMLYTYHPNLGNTAIRAVAICRTLGEVLQLSSKDLRVLTLAAQLHDIGLMNIEVGIIRRWLRDPEKCTEEELELIEEHPATAEAVLKEVYDGYFEDAAEVVRAHHENWDGSGYPDKLKGETIPRLARLLSPVIFFCNQHSTGVQVLTQLEHMADQVFDPDAVRALATAVPRTRMPRGEREILLIELKAGMVLARDIFNTNGMKLLPSGRELTDGAINKVLSINRVTPINPLCLVYC